MTLRDKLAAVKRYYCGHGVMWESDDGEFVYFKDRDALLRALDVALRQRDELFQRETSGMVFLETTFEELQEAHDAAILAAYEGGSTDDT